MSEPTAAMARLLERKQQLRAEARSRRDRQPHKDQLSRQICLTLAALPEYAAAATVMFYVDFGAEVRTRHFLPAVWAAGKRVVVPYCAADHLELFHLQSLDELAPGALGILEPAAALRGRGDRKADVAELDLIAVPGLAFDRNGGRIGYGKGYYDKLLAAASPHTRLIAIAFQCQVVPEVPMTPYDMYVAKVVTESAVYERSRSTG